MQLSLVKLPGGALMPLTDDDKALIDKKRVGSVLEGIFKENRNPRLHRKYFALLNLGFDYWTPSGGAISPQERNLVCRFARELSKLGGAENVLLSLANDYLNALAGKRANIEVEKSFTAYRKWVVAEAGFYKTVTLPNGTVKREAKSISFANMDDREFDELYTASLTVIWNHILHSHFATKAEVDRAVNTLLGFA
ncbi:DUF1367 family protein [Salinivibrio sp. YCSC6]|uniref:DUF1367 family protein n=1 Tax=Salinivibrio sp. YCSC6 TaxID=2003370 RepID=UPI000BBC710B|nr:DUF1367 family protein [Salinivibrio sp. YCSC6]PCE67562.1 hypothetical protein B6G00_04230 [Salinivibrio sp. YCSC6]QCF35533.1 DUF1367 family protein [Salinivibrio sp. YCSC6]